MHALIMAGGAGTRLNLGEKPLVLISGRPMIAYVIGAFELAGCEPVIAVSHKTPMTLNWCRARNIAFCKTAGTGFVDDMIEAVGFLEEENPLFISVSDIPFINAEIIRSIARAYECGGRDALSTWVPADLVPPTRGGMPCHEVIGGIDACPAGVNILRGDRIDEVQDELVLLLDEPSLALNVNTRADLAEAELRMRSVSQG